MTQNINQIPTEEDVEIDADGQFSRATLESNPLNWLCYRRYHDLFYNVKDEDINKIVIALQIKQRVEDRIKYLKNEWWQDDRMIDQLQQLLKGDPTS